tara:strand:+ start:773 stop:1168 length:396 start_codon:yes stop_codon:yes gene_type:complete
LKDINIITPPDWIFNDAVQVLLVFPSEELQTSVQEHLVDIEDDINIYVYDKEVYSDNDTDWLLTVFKMSDITIIDVDMVKPYLRDLLSYMIAKPKTYWLTKGENRVYNKLSNNRFNDFKFLSKLGGNFETK